MLLRNKPLELKDIDDKWFSGAIKRCGSIKKGLDTQRHGKPEGNTDPERTIGQIRKIPNNNTLASEVPAKVLTKQNHDLVPH